MRIAVLGSTGGVGRHLVTYALQRGHRVTAIARDPAQVQSDVSDHLQVVAGDVTDPGSLTGTLDGVDAVVSGLGSTKGGPEGVLTAGATALAAGHARVVWLTAVGSGSSAAQVGILTRLVLPLALGRAELADKARAETLLLPTGASVLAAGPLTGRQLSPDRRTVALADLPRRPFAATVSRATVAAAMLEEAEHPRFAGAVGVILS